ncbi:MAG: hypothetical protein PUA69_08165 [Erysipelotrichaceae bacterium]|nr:hypothetical protein [Erysipelotrichaceae bacterium]
MNHIVFMLVMYVLAAVLAIDGIMTIMHKESLKKADIQKHSSILDIYDGIILLGSAYTVICFAYRTMYHSDIANKLMWSGIIVVLAVAVFRFTKSQKNESSVK